jgi:hypothetical protein
MSRSGILSMSGALLRAILATSVLLSSGCAYFHPAFVTNASQLQPPAAQGERGVLVCERHSLTRKDCTVMPQSEVTRLLSEVTGRH